MPNETVARKPRADGTLYTLQAGRGLAAFAVVLHHADNAVAKQVGALPDWLSAIAAYGYLGVDFFFVLSGFIIYYVNYSRVDRPGFARAYLTSRTTRVYIPYWPIGIAVGMAYLLFADLASAGREWDWFSTITLLPSFEHPALGPAWTLQHEVVFYLFALVAFLSRRFWLVMAGGVVLAVAGWFMFPTNFKAMGLVDLEFLFGVIAAWLFVQGRLANQPVLIAVGLAACSVFFLAIDQRFYSVVFGLGVAFLLLAVVREEAAGKVAVGRFLRLLGDASYAIYLIHYPMMSVGARLGDSLHPMTVFIGLSAFSVIAGIVYHLAFEKPAIRWVKARIDRPAKERRKVAQKA